VLIRSNQNDTSAEAGACTLKALPFRAGDAFYTVSNYTVEFSEQFEADFDACYLRMSRISPKSAAGLQNGVLEACFSLSQFPRRCSLAPEAEAFSQEVRLLLYRNRKAIYRRKRMCRKRIQQARDETTNGPHHWGGPFRLL